MRAAFSVHAAADANFVRMHGFGHEAQPPAVRTTTWLTLTITTSTFFGRDGPVGFCKIGLSAAAASTGKPVIPDAFAVNPMDYSLWMCGFGECIKVGLGSSCGCLIVMTHAVL